MISSSGRLVAHRAAQRTCRNVRPRNRNLSTSLSSKPISHDRVSVFLGVALASAAAVTMTPSARHTVTEARPLPNFGSDERSDGKFIEEKATGHMFPNHCNGMPLAGLAPRYLLGLLKVCAVGTYVDPAAIAPVKNGSKEDIEKALLNPDFPRTIRVTMNLKVSVKNYNMGSAAALKPLMNGKDDDKLQEFMDLNPPDVDIVKGTAFEMTILGDTVWYKDASGSVGSVQSRALTEAICEIYFGSKPASPQHKKAVIEGIQKL